ncbi:MAG: hypothetical protein NBV67_14660 [Tagaea sp.]|nr:hypothetical protein [Tagaea sp.]
MTRIRRKRSLAVLGVCEGRSEETYFRAIGRLIREAIFEAPPSIKTHVVGGGSAAVVVEEAVRAWQRARRIGAPFDFGCILVDRAVSSDEERRLTAAMARLSGLPFEVVLQPGSHEAFLLHHFPDDGRVREITTLMPGYRKGCDANLYARHIGREQYALAQARYPALAAFFVRCGFVPSDDSA